MRTPVVHPLSDALPAGPWRELHDYVKIDAQGKACGEFNVSSWSIDDELSVQAYAVIAGELRERTERTFYGSRDQESSEEKTGLTGLRDVDDRKTLAFLEKALAAEQLRVDDHSARLRREGEARVAAIPGATEDPGFGADYLRAQEVLRDRVRSYDEALYVDLLRTLGLLGNGPALDAYIAACRHAAFDPTVNRKKKRPKESATSQRNTAAPRKLKETLATLQRQLLEQAEGQDQADAPQNAAAYRKAAELVGKAVELIDVS
jgi:hypothetical protein